VTTQPSLIDLGEHVHVPERVIVAPDVGVFRPHAIAGWLCAGDQIGVLESPGMRVPVECPFEGALVGMLAVPGERLRRGQAVAWLRVA
jgi:hypothetical protein